MKYLLRSAIRHVLEDEGELPFGIYYHEREIGNFVIPNSSICYSTIFSDNYIISYLVSSQDLPLEELEI
jgi:hypothetical protein